MCNLSNKRNAELLDEIERLIDLGIEEMDEARIRACLTLLDQRAPL